MSAGFRAGNSSDAYIQVDGVDKIKVDNNAVTLSTANGLVVGAASGYINVAPSAGSALIVLNKPSGAYSSTLYGSRGTTRWGMDMGNTATESGSNVGSDFAISRYDDTGTFIATALLITRSTGVITAFGHTIPGTTNTYDLGTSSLRWRNIYTMDLQLSNGIGDYTIVEGADDLFLYNNKNGKTYKFLIQEVDPSVVPAKVSND